MKKTAVLLLFLLMLVSAAFSGGADLSSPDLIRPEETSWDSSSVPEGRYRFGVKDAEHLEEGTLILSLYAEDQYAGAEIENLKPGDAVEVNGIVYTTALVVIHGYYDADGDGETDYSCTMIKDLDQYPELLDAYGAESDFDDPPESYELSAYELYTVEDLDGYIAFEPLSDGDFRAVQNDWSPCTYLGDVTVLLPLPEGFVFLDWLDDEYGVEEFWEDFSPDWYSPYNSEAWFENGLLVKVSHSDYPEGPDADLFSDE